MLKKIKDMRMKQSFIFLTVTCIFLGLISVIGIVEVVKIADFQRYERQHVVHLDQIIFRLNNLEKLTESKENASEIKVILEKKSDKTSEMGIARLLEEMKKQTEKFFAETNFLEKFLFKISGFGEVIDLVEDDLEAIIMMQNTVEEYGRHTISYGWFVETIKEYVKKVRVFDEEFAEVINSAGHFVSVFMISLLVAGMLVTGVTGFFIFRSIMTPLSKTTKNICSFSQELQANSKQQTQAASGQTAAMTEIGSVMQELVATSGQVADISSNATSIVKNADKEVADGHLYLDDTIEGIEKIKEKVEISAANMLSLGEKSQQIGVVLDVINELSQQVTVLSYNATIEAAGAGEEGKRFMAVADRIIKLAERSVESAKEVKSIIDDIQSDSNKTIMSTEDSMKAVEEGVTRVKKAKNSLNSINELTNQVLVSVDEISMSLNQQKTGVEQAAAEVENITILVRESEDSARQVSDTAAHLLEMADALESI